MSKAKLTLGRFEEIEHALRTRLADELDSDLSCALPELGQDIGTDLWTPPAVDSKTVVKLSPTVKELTGYRLDPTWIHKGGYLSVTDAVEHIVMQIRLNCVDESATVEPAAAAMAHA